MTQAALNMDSTLTSALDAVNHGISVVRVRNDGTKRPVGEWKQYQTERADVDTVTGWFRTSRYGVGVVCGAVSGDLEMLELEGRFMADIGSERFKQACRDAGLLLLLSRLINGFMVTSPSNGRHFYYRVQGEALANTKLANRPDANGHAEVLIETRGEGGFVVAPPSGGDVHPSRRAWQTKAATWANVPTITVDEREALFAVCRSFDTMPPTVVAPMEPVGKPVAVKPASVAPNASWMDALADHLDGTMRSTLEHYGWTHTYTDRHGRELFSRPGKDDGVSGSINANGRLRVFSTSTPFVADGTPPPTYDVIDVVAAYEHRGDRIAAARDLADRAGITTKRQAPPPNVDPNTGEIIATDVGALDDEFWNARPYLATIRQAALSRMVAPTAVLGCVLARVSAFTPPSTCLPPLVGGTSTLSIFAALYAHSGGGKTTAVACAEALLPTVPAGCIAALPLGSGEGLSDSYFDMVEETDGSGKKTKVKRQTRYGALFLLDEGQVLAEFGKRSGSTTASTIRTSWTGTHLGQANASAETKRLLRAGTYSIGIISLWQLNAAMTLIGDVDGGTPQRFVWFATTSQEISEDVPEWPGELDWTPPPTIALGGNLQPAPMKVCVEVAHLIRSERARVGRGELLIDPLDTHRNLATLKVAGVLAVLDGRRDIEQADWSLAQRIMRHSDGVRGWVVGESERRRQAHEEARLKAQIMRDAMVEGSAVERALTQAARSAWRATTKAADGRVTRRMVHAAMASRIRQAVTIDDAIGEAIRLRWLVEDGDGHWKAGDAAPR